MNYKIADVVLSVSLPDKLHVIFQPFLTAESADIQAEWVKTAGDYYGIDILNLENVCYSLKAGNSVLLANKDWTSGRIYGTSESELSTLLEMLLYSYLLTRKTILFHSSLVDWNGHGIMFIGPSGIGKTTQAELWAKYQDAEILNGDLVFVREDTDGYYGYGSPWHGSSSYYENARVKLDALVVLHQGKDNILTCSKSYETEQKIMEQAFLPGWYQEAMNAALNTSERILSDILTYDLICRADKQATEVLKTQYLKHIVD